MQVPAHLAKFAAKFNDASKFTMPSGMSFPHIAIGKERFTAIDAEGNETLLGLDGFEFIAVDSNPATSKIYYDTPYAGDAEGAPPACYSDNGYYPDIRASKPQAESCALCQWSSWGSAKSKLTGKDIKACQDFKKLAVLPLHEEIEDVHMFRVSPAALGNWSRYVNELRKIGGDCGFEVTPSLVVTNAFWSEAKNVMDFEFVDFLDEDTGAYVEQLKEENVHEAWIGLDAKAQEYPMLSSQPRGQQQRLEAPKDTRRPSEERIQDAEVVEEKTRRGRNGGTSAEKSVPSASARRGLKSAEPVPGRARADAQALGATQGEERKMTPIEIAKARAKAQMAARA